MRKIIAKALSFIGGVQKDKLLHFVAGVLIVAVVALWRLIAPYAWTLGVVVGATKEWYDKRNGGEIDVWDFVATVFGALVMQVLVWLYLIAW